MEKEVIWTAEDVINICRQYMNEKHVAIVQKACDFATYVHKEQRRKSGETIHYPSHPGCRYLGRVKDGSWNGQCGLFYTTSLKIPR